MKTFIRYSAVLAYVTPFCFFVSCGDREEVSQITKPVVVSTTDVEDVVMPVEVEDEKPVEDKKPEAPVKPEPKPLPFMEKALKEQTMFVQGSAVSRKEIEGEPKHYIVFLTAEWCAKSKENIGLIKKLYEEEILPDPNLELLMVSVDSDSSWVHKWAVKEQFKWPMLMREQLDGLPEIKKLGDLYAYSFVLFDKEGVKQNANTLDECMALVGKGE